MMETATQNLAEVSDLIAVIQAAFAGVPRGNGITWHEAEELDNYATEAERASARGLDVDTNWNEVAPELLDDLPSAVHFLDGSGFRYYLPAFMVSDTRRAGHRQSAIADGYLGELASAQRLRDLLPLLTNNQKRAIYDWIIHQSRRTPWYHPEAADIWSVVISEKSSTKEQ